MSERATLELSGHIIDSLILAKVLDRIVDSGSSYEIQDLTVGRAQGDPSSARIEVHCVDGAALTALFAELVPHGARRVDAGDASLEPAPCDGVLPSPFHATTNLPTSVRIDGAWLAAEPAEMDCALVVDPDRTRARPVERPDGGHLGRLGLAQDRSFSFMSSEVSSEKPKGLAVTHVAERLRAVKAAGVGAALMLASTLHSIATGNLLPASVETFCVDIHQAVVTKLADRGSHQVLGIVTDVGLFVRELAQELRT